jgi:hypothetical protein
VHHEEGDGKEVFLLMIFVDDILILADNAKLHSFENFLKAEFIAMEVDKK